MDADLCLLDRPWAEARRGLNAVEITATLKAGHIVHG
jgi:predicted amidohydrolase YtcJ